MQTLYQQVNQARTAHDRITQMTTEKSSERLARVVAQSHRDQLERNNAYRERALKMYPWVCGRCAREFNRSNLRELTVHHRDHNHDNNPPDGSNWELLCVYCHDNEHSRYVDAQPGAGTTAGKPAEHATHKPFSDLAAMLGKTKPGQ